MRPGLQKENRQLIHLLVKKRRHLKSGNKRNRLSGNTPSKSQESSAKRTKTGMTYQEAMTTKMAIVSEKSPDEVITEDQIGILQTALVKAFEPLKDDQYLQFFNAYTERGTCANEIAQEWLSTLVSKLKPWENV